MARDVNDTVVIGFGSWSSVGSLPTLGYDTYPGSFPGSCIVGQSYVMGAQTGMIAAPRATIGAVINTGVVAGQKVL